MQKADGYDHEAEELALIRANYSEEMSPNRRYTGMKQCEFCDAVYPGDEYDYCPECEGGLLKGRIWPNV